MYRVIMVPLDSLDFGRHAIPWAVAIARPAGALIRLVHVHEPTYGLSGFEATPADADMVAAQVVTARTELQAFADRVAAGAGVRVAASVEEGSAADALLRHTGAHDVDLIAMTTHGRGGAGRALLGSVADVVVRDSRLPVLLIRPSGPLPTETETATIRHVLVPLDGSSLAEEIVEHALAACVLTGASCTLLQVATSPLLSGIAAPDALVDQSAADVELDHIEAYLERVAVRFRDRAVAVEVRAVRDIDPAAAISEYASAHGVTLIAMTTHGRKGVARVMQGSTADALARKSSLPLLVLHGRQETGEPSGANR